MSYIVPVPAPLNILPISSLDVDHIRLDVTVHPILIISLLVSIFVYNRLLVGEGNIQLFLLDKHSNLTLLPSGNRDQCRVGNCLHCTNGSSPLMRIRGGNRDLELGGCYERDACRERRLRTDLDASRVVPGADFGTLVRI